MFLNLFAENIIDERDSIKACALTWAAFEGHIDIVKLLLERGADIEAKGTHDRTALGWAAQAGKPDIAALLMEKGAAAGVMDENGFTPLMLAHAGDFHGIAEMIAEYQDVPVRQVIAEERQIERAAAQAAEDLTAARLDQLKTMRPEKVILKKPRPPQP
jgi:ankyrin repeat protein